jgi:chemotaxis signal transduction protein
MSLANSETAKSRPGRPSEQVILFSVGNHSFAIAAEAVQEIRSTDSLSGTATEIENSEIEKVQHTLKHGRHSLYVVNARLHFGLPASRPTLVMILRGMRVAVLVDRIERMAEVSFLHRLPCAFIGRERKWYRALAYMGDRVIPVVHAAGFLDGEEIQYLDSIAAARQPVELEGAVRE